MKESKNNKIQIIKAATIAAACLTVSIGGVLATYVSTQDLPSKISLGKIDIDTKLEMEENNQYVDYVSPDLIVPGAQINQRMTLSNNGDSCYIRLKFDFNCDNKDLIFDTTSLSLTNPEKWVYKAESDGQYLYYVDEVKNNQNIIVYDGFDIPNWDNSSSGTNIHANIVVQAIQSQNFTQDLNAAYPWGNDVEITEYSESI